MNGAAIAATGIGKRYRLGGRAPYRTLRETLAGFWRRRPRRAETFWALRDVSFEIAPGEVVGVIGRNGAGKSTLLKVLSSITEPTEGHAELRGRVGSLLEVGTGFHPELSGRENIFLNGAILGMRRREIVAKLDDIVAFAEVEQFLDTAVKHYSSGMYLRLAFALAAHLEPEILLVDEVLAVGDAAFQQRCLGKMGEVARGGRTVLFVSHNLGAVRRLCRSGLLLDGGRLVCHGSIDDVIDRYTAEIRQTGAEVTYEPREECVLQIVAARLLDAAGEPSVELDRMQPFRLEITYDVRRPLTGAHLSVMLDRADGTPVCYSTDLDAAPEEVIDRREGRYRTTAEYPGGILNGGVYKLRLGTGRYGGPPYDYCEPFVFTLNDRGTFASFGAGGRQRPGVLSIALDWRTDEFSPQP